MYGFHFTLLTDHNPLTSLKGLKDTGGRIARWMLYLQQLDFVVKYKPGRANSNADALSRAVNVIGSPSTQPTFGLENIQEAQEKDDFLATVIEELKLKKVVTGLNKQSHRLFIRDDGTLCRWFRENRLAHARVQVLIPSSLQDRVLKQLHDFSGHCGVKNTLEKLKERFYWPGYEAAVEEYVKSCRQCQTRKSPNPKTAAPIGTIQSSRPFEWVSWDITGPLPETEKGNRYILVVT